MATLDLDSRKQSCETLINIVISWGLWKISGSRYIYSQGSNQHTVARLYIISTDCKLSIGKIESNMQQHCSVLHAIFPRLKCAIAQYHHHINMFRVSLSSSIYANCYLCFYISFMQGRSATALTVVVLLLLLERLVIDLKIKVKCKNCSKTGNHKTSRRAHYVRCISWFYRLN